MGRLSPSQAFLDQPGTRYQATRKPQPLRSRTAYRVSIPHPTWRRFNGWSETEGRALTVQELRRLRSAAATRHPAWDRCPAKVWDLHARNVAVLVGPDACEPVCQSAFKIDQRVTFPRLTTLCPGPLEGRAIEPWRIPVTSDSLPHHDQLLRNLVGPWLGSLHSTPRHSFAPVSRRSVLKPLMLSVQPSLCCRRHR